MLKLTDICKEYKTGDLIQKALDHVSLSFRDNEFVAILGPSGSGKTTLLNIVGGLDHYDSGDLVINGVSTKKYRDRDWDSYRNRSIGFVFQSYNLIPHQNILSNVELALTISGVPVRERKKRAIEALEKVGLGDQLHKKPNQLSGGQMQRVAIARALVNNPSILLADEPTGALDSETSIQVMELLKEVAKDRLVVMVTHNPDLAYQYATRIVKLKDGKITDDSDPFEIAEDKPPVHKNLGKAVMHFFTALGLSFNNLKSKLSRTVLVAFAGSIGITGIALILSLSNGVNEYIAGIEEQAITEYPLTITSSSFNMNALLAAPGSNEAEGEVIERKTLSDLFSKVENNDLKSLKGYFEGELEPLKNDARAVEYKYSIVPQIFKLTTAKDGSPSYRQINPDQTLSTLGFSVDSSLLSMTAFSLDVFSAMPAEDSLYKGKYDVKAGRWPEDPYECVVVLSESGRISDLTLYALGLKDYSIFENIIKNYLTGKSTKSEETPLTFAYDDLLDIEFKVVNAADFYVYDQEYQVYTDNHENREYMQKLVENGRTLKVVGVVMPSPNAEAATLGSGILYEPELITELIKEAAGRPAVADQLASRTVDVVTGLEFGTVDRGTFDLLSLFSVDEQAIMDAFKFDPGALNLDFSGIDLSALTAQLSVESLTEIVRNNINTDPIDDSELRAILENIDFRVTTEKLTGLLTEAMADFIAFANADPEFTITDAVTREAWNAEIEKWSGTENAAALIDAFAEENAEIEKTREDINRELDDISEEVRNRMNTLYQAVVQTIAQRIGAVLRQQMANAITQVMKDLPKAISVDGEALMKAISFNMTEAELASLMNSMMSGSITTQEGNLKKMGYVDMETPSSIYLYAYDFKTKDNIKATLNKYNRIMVNTDQSEKVITYTDIVGTLMSSVETIVNVISYVLIGFVAISLIVSSIMIAVITFISVLERRKEIGILRALGASKNNVAQVFNAETVIIGLLSGIFGVGFSLIDILIINAILARFVTEVYIRALLTVPQIIILVVISVFLSVISGLIPSSKAAKQDPVLALRSE